MKASWGRPCLLLVIMVLAETAEPQPLPVVRTTLDAAGDVGSDSSIAIGADGLGLVSYYDATNRDLKVAHCSNVECTAATITTLDSAGDVGASTSLTIGGDGLGLIAYLDATNEDLKIAHCSNVLCTSATIRTVDSAGFVGGGSIATGSDGLGLIAYSAGLALKTAHCLDATCSGAVLTAHPGQGGNSIDLMVGADGLGLAVDLSHNGFVAIVRAIHCSNLDCSAATVTPISEAPFNYYGERAAIVRASNGLGFVSARYYNFQGLYIDRIGPCLDAPCTSAALVDQSGGHSIALGVDGFPLLADDRYSGGGIWVQDCQDASCTGLRRNRIDAPGNVQPSIALGVDQRPLVSYRHDAVGDLRVAHCTNPDCFIGGADLDADLGYWTPSSLVTGTPSISPGKDLRLFATAYNRGPDAEPEATLRMNIPARFLVQQIIPGPPTCNVAAGQLECRSTAPVPNGFTAEVRTLVDYGPTELLPVTVTVSGTLFDVDLTNQQAQITFYAFAACSISGASIMEGDAGTSDAVFTVRRPPSQTSMEATVTFHTENDSAIAGVDYVATSGMVTFPVGQEEAAIRVPVLGDSAPESDERFWVTIDLFPTSCAMSPRVASADIIDDDAPSLSTRELSHGSSEWHTAARTPADFYRMRQEPFASYEIVLDGASGDMTPLAIERIAADNSTVLQSALSLGTSASLRWVNSTASVLDNQHLHVVGAGCGGGCGPDDVYRIRAYETTASIPRFNNAGQISVLILQNTSPDTVAGQLRFWSPVGSTLATRSFSLAPQSSLVLNTTTVPGLPGNGGTVTISHDGRYGALAGKMIALEPATGYSFDSPLTYRPR